MLSKKINPITFFSSFVAFLCIAYPNIDAQKYSWWLIVPGVFIFILICGAHTGTIVYDNIISMKKYNSTTARLLILIGISLVISLIGLITFHNLYQ